MRTDFIPIDPNRTYHVMELRQRFATTMTEGVARIGNAAAQEEAGIVELGKLLQVTIRWYDMEGREITGGPTGEE